MEGSVRDHSELVKGAWLEKKTNIYQTNKSHPVNKKSWLIGCTKGETVKPQLKLRNLNFFGGLIVSYGSYDKILGPW